MSAATGLPAAPVPLFDLQAGWDRLAPDARRKFGMAALAVGLGQLAGGMIEEEELTDSELAAATAGGAFFDAGIREGTALLAVLTDVYVIDGQPGLLRPPDLQGLQVNQCRVCGCTDAHGTRKPPEWSAPGLCTPCSAAGGV